MTLLSYTEKLHTPVFVDRTHDAYDADGLITWSPYRASDEAAHIVLPESQVRELTQPQRVGPKLQALVYDILPSTTAVFSYAIRSRKLSANEQFFCWCSNSSKCVTNNSNKTRRVIYSRQESLHQHK